MGFLKDREIAPSRSAGRKRSWIAIFRAFLIALCLLGGLGVQHLMASQPDYILMERLAPGSTSEIIFPLSFAFAEEELEPTPFVSFQKKLGLFPPFWRDTKLQVHLRSYYFFDWTANPLVKQEAWALGGWLAYESGWLWNRLKIGGAVYTTQRLYGPPDRDGTLLLASGQRGFTVLGQAYVVGRIVDQFQVKVYRQSLNLPFINKHDNRMVPNTFEAYVLKGRTLGKTAKPAIVDIGQIGPVRVAGHRGEAPGWVRDQGNGRPRMQPHRPAPGGL